MQKNSQLNSEKLYNKRQGHIAKASQCPSRTFGLGNIQRTLSILTEEEEELEEETNLKPQKNSKNSLELFINQSTKTLEKNWYLAPSCAEF